MSEFELLAPPGPPASRETERSMLDRLRVRYGRTYANGSYRGRQYVIAEKVPTTRLALPLTCHYKSNVRPLRAA